MQGGVTIRAGRPDEAQRIADFALAGMRVELYPGLRFDAAKLRSVVEHLLSGQAHGFQRIAVNEAGDLVGIVAAVAVPMLFFERMEAVVIACRAIHPGAGRALLRELKAWADADMAVRRVVWPIEFHAPESTVRLARRLGFTQVAHACTYEKE